MLSSGGAALDTLDCSEDLRYRYLKYSHNVVTYGFYNLHEVAGPMIMQSQSRSYCMNLLSSAVPASALEVTPHTPLFIWRLADLQCHLGSIA